MKVKYRVKGPIGRAISLNQPSETKNLDFLNSKFIGQYIKANREK